MEYRPYYHALKELYEDAVRIRICKKHKWVIFSDLHLGNGGSRDDFKKNSELFQCILKRYYLRNDFYLVLNGDVEEDQKFSFPKVWQRWQPVFKLFNEFKNREKFYKLVGNHDRLLMLEREYPYLDHMMHSLILEYKGNEILIFHGDQASVFYQKYNHLLEYLLKYVAYPLRINSTSTAYDSRKKYFVESRVYEFSRKHKIISVIGHTHRPLFESHSKIDMLRFQIEDLCRAYDTSKKKARLLIEQEISHLTRDLNRILARRKYRDLSSLLYNEDVMVPCLFNSGCVVGKRGVTAIEIENGKIALVHWFDAKKQKKYLDHEEFQPETLDNTHCHRVVLRQDSLNYIFNRIQLLA